MLDVQGICVCTQECEKYVGQMLPSGAEPAALQSVALQAL